MRAFASILATLLTSAMLLLASVRCECAVAGPASSNAAAACPCCSSGHSSRSAPVHAMVCLRCSGTLTVERLACPDVRPMPALLPCRLPSVAVFACPQFAGGQLLVLAEQRPFRDNGTLLQLHCALTV